MPRLSRFAPHVSIPKIDVNETLCADFDLCSSCLPVQPDNIGFHFRQHAFFAIEEPGGVWTHTVFAGENTPEPPEHPAKEEDKPPTVTSSGPVKEQITRTDDLVVHNATCDLCSSTINGDRFVSVIYMLWGIKFLTAPRNASTAQTSTSALHAMRSCLLNILVTALPAYATRWI